MGLAKKELFLKALIFYSHLISEPFTEFEFKNIIKNWDFLGIIIKNKNKFSETVKNKFHFDISKKYLEEKCKKYNVDILNLPEKKFCFCHNFIYNPCYIINKNYFNILVICQQCCKKIKIKQNNYKICIKCHEPHLNKKNPECHKCAKFCLNCKGIKKRYERFCSDCKKKNIKKQIERTEKKYQNEEYLNIYYSIDSIFFSENEKYIYYKNNLENYLNEIQILKVGFGKYKNISYELAYKDVYYKKWLYSLKHISNHEMRMFIYYCKCKDILKTNIKLNTLIILYNEFKDSFFSLELL